MSKKKNKNKNKNANSTNGTATSNSDSNNNTTDNTNKSSNSYSNSKDNNNKSNGTMSSEKNSSSKTTPTTSNGTSSNGKQSNTNSNSNNKNKDKEKDKDKNDKDHICCTHDDDPEVKLQREKHRKRHHHRHSHCLNDCCCWTWFSIIAILLVVLISFPVKENLDPEDKIVDTLLENELLANLAGAQVERPGLKLAREGLKPHYPVIFIPGVVSTGLEVWQGKPCARKHFRERFWGTTLMIRKILLSRKCWLEHVSMNYSTWEDPEGVKLRAATGLFAADYFVGDYWVWGKIIENLADLGYDESNIYMASYDWRLPCRLLEKRDSYFTRLTSAIELFKQVHDKKVVILMHSMGAQVTMYYLNWVQSRNGGRRGAHWVNDHIHAVVNIGGPLLGVPKAISTLMSGEMRDTAELNPLLNYVKENFMSKNDLLGMFRSFGSIASMLPRGGDRIWGDGLSAADNSSDNGNMVTFRSEHENPSDASASLFQKFLDLESTRQAVEEAVDNKMDEITDCLDSSTGRLEPLLNDTEKQAILGRDAYTVEETLEILRKIAPDFMSKVDDYYSYGVARDVTPDYYENDKYWNNPLESQLPFAPDMTMYCMYGIGKAAERSYHYKENKEKCSNIPFSINTALLNDTAGIYYGVGGINGDGTVPLISLGYMCVKGWKDKVYNPSQLPVVTIEFRHEAQGILEARGQAITGNVASVLRGGITTADHVDIMGNYEMLEMILRIATNDNNQTLKEDRIFSDIKDISERVNLNR